jgi:type IV pilus assembly protein PilZ
MAETEILNYIIKEPVELNLSYMPFINDGGLFIPTFQTYTMGDTIFVDLLLPGKKDSLRIEGKIIWITPPNALHHVLPGIGIQFIGTTAPFVRGQVEANLDKTMDIGGYSYGMTEGNK